MRVNKLHTPIGLRDILPDEYEKRRVLLERLEGMFRRSGYRGIDTPMLEYLEVFSAEEMGGMDSNQMYKLFDRDGASLALRADMTPPIARIAATAYAREEGPLRFYYVGNALRENANYQGKAHEFCEAGVELLGTSSAEADGEALSLAIRGLLDCGLQEMKIHVGQVAFFKAVIEESGLTEEDAAKLQEFIARRDYVAGEAILKNLDIRPKSKELFLSLPKLVGGPEVLAAAKALTESPRALEALEYLEELYEILHAYGVSKYINFDLGMVNRLNYYTGIIFRGYTYGTGYSLVDGGRYDHLAEQFGKSRPAVGFSIRVAELMNALQYQNIAVETEETDTLLAYEKDARDAALAAASLFRSMGLPLEVSLLGSGVEKNYTYMKERGMERMLYFKDAENLLVTICTDEGDFDLDTTLAHLMETLGGGME